MFANFMALLDLQWAVDELFGPDWLMLWLLDDL